MYYFVRNRHVLDKPVEAEFSSRFKFRVKNYIKKMVDLDEYVASYEPNYISPSFKQWSIIVSDVRGNTRVFGYLNKGLFE